MTMWTDHLKKCAAEYQRLKARRANAVVPKRRVQGKQTLQKPVRRLRGKANPGNDID